MALRRPNEPEEKKPILFRDGVLLFIAAIGAGVCMYMADHTDSELGTAYRAWEYVLGGIALLILLSLVSDMAKKKKKKDLY